MWRLWRRLRSHAGGAALPFLAAGFFVMVAAIGSAIDMGRIYIVKSQMQAAVDAAALAGANAFDNASETDENGRYKQASYYYLDNLRNGYMGLAAGSGTAYGSSQTMQKPAFAVVNGISRTTVTANGSLPMTFMRMFGVENFAVTATGTAEFQPHPLEVMVVLDNTGSMIETIDGVSKMTSLKNAMHSFLNVLYQGAANQPDLALGILNYTITANVGDVLKEAGVQIEPVAQFTTRNWSAGDNLGWKGCVAGDDTVNTMTDGTTTLEADAFDVWNRLPGEKPKPSSSKAMPAIRPFFYPPMYIPSDKAADKAVPGSQYYAVSGAEYGNNLFTTPNVDYATASTLANSPMYKRYLYRMYKGLNNGSGASMSDDVIVASDQSSYYDPTAPGAYNDATGTGDASFFVRVDKVPNSSIFKPATHYDVASNNTPLPSPNWQCPEGALKVRYGIPKSTYDNFVDNKVWAVKPANGTMHHIGFVWGWRLLTRYDVFTRTPPAGSGRPRRALVFMTDGNTAFTVDGSEGTARNFAAYGSPNELRIATSATQSAYQTAAKARFSKACAIANQTPTADNGEAPMIFTVAINRGSDIQADDSNRLRNCGTSGYYLTTSPAALDAAFREIARTLTDVHLTK